MWFWSRPRLREVALVGLPLLLLIAGGFLLALQFVKPAPPRTIVMSTGAPDGAYNAFGKQYADILARSGVTLELRGSQGTADNLARLEDESSRVQVALAQSGIPDAHIQPHIVSLGRMFLQPLWVFHRSDSRIDRLSQLAGKRVQIGPKGSGTAPLAIALLKANDVTAATATLSSLSNTEAVKQLLGGQIDALFVSMAVDGGAVQTLLHSQGVRLMNFSQADAYIRKFPYLAKATLPMGVVDLVGNIPPEDVTLLAPAGALLAREDLHPALIGLLVEAAQEVHSGGGMFQQIGEYPKPFDTELPLSEHALRAYKNGPPFLQRYMPFWLATFLERMVVMVVPITTILLPLFKFVPMAYRWRVRQRIFFWYDKLKMLERKIRADKSPARLAGYREEIDRIDEAVSVIPIPLIYSDKFYSLRSAVGLVRQRIASLPQT